MDTVRPMDYRRRSFNTLRIYSYNPNVVGELLHFARELRATGGEKSANAFTRMNIKIHLISDKKCVYLVSLIYLVLFASCFFSPLSLPDLNLKH